MLDAAVQSASITELCDALLSIDTVRVYKPRPEAYALVTSHFGIQPQDAVFVSSNRWDIMGAAKFGFRPVWVNRGGVPDEYADAPPIRTITGLASL
jgi:2-haloacid dehalogenase